MFLILSACSLCNYLWSPGVIMSFSCLNSFMGFYYIAARYSTSRVPENCLPLYSHFLLFCPMPPTTHPSLDVRCFSPQCLCTCSFSCPQTPSPSTSCPYTENLSLWRLLQKPTQILLLLQGLLSRRDNCSSSCLLSLSIICFCTYLTHLNCWSMCLSPTLAYAHLDACLFFFF